MANETEQLPPLYMMAGLIDEVIADARRRHDAYVNKKQLGPITGLKRLDEVLGQALQSGVHVVHGGPGAGKSAFAWQLAGHCECPALFISCEMAAQEMFRRLIARETGEFLGKLKNGELTPERVQQLATQAAEKVPYLALMDGTKVAATIPHIYQTAKLLRDTHSKDGHLLVVVDSLHTWASKAYSGMEEYERLTRACDDLTTIAQSLNCAFLVVSERNRGSMKNEGQNSGAGSRRIEYSAETVFGLDAEKAEGEKSVKLHIGKNRNGAADVTINLVLNGAMQKFTEPAIQ